jgi:hypothetical protein
MRTWLTVWVISINAIVIFLIPDLARVFGSPNTSRTERLVGFGVSTCIVLVLLLGIAAEVKRSRFASWINAGFYGGIFSLSLLWTLGLENDNPEVLIGLVVVPISAIAAALTGGLYWIVHRKTVASGPVNGSS